MKLVNETVAAEILGTTKKHMQMMRWKGVGPKYVKISASVRYSDEELQRYILERTIDPSKK